MLTIPGVPSAAIATSLMQLAAVLIAGSGIAFMVGLRRLAFRLVAIAALLVLAACWPAQTV